MEQQPETTTPKASPPLSRCGRTEEEIQRIEGRIKISRGAMDRSRKLIPYPGSPGPGDMIAINNPDGTRTIVTIRE